jgi:chromosome partitioning protein
MIIGLTNSKGGVGKTTISVHLAIWLAKSGKNVILVDSDVQCSSSNWITAINSNVRLERLQTPDEILDKIPKLANETDHIVIDGPAGLSEVTRAIMLRAEQVYLPCGPSALDLWAADDAIRVLRQAQSIRGGLPTATFIPNKLQRNYRLSKEVMEAAGKFGIEVAPGLSLRQAYADAAGQGSVVWEMGSSAAVASMEIETLFQSIIK